MAASVVVLVVVKNLPVLASHMQGPTRQRNLCVSFSVRVSVVLPKGASDQAQGHMLAQPDQQVLGYLWPLIPWLLVSYVQP